jgi:SSS family transporter
MNSLATIDWVVIGAFFAFVMVVGALASRGKETAAQFFLGNRRTPLLAAALSTIATSLSAVTFIGAPADAFAGNLTYVSLNIGGILGALFVAVFFVPAYFRANVASIYELLGQRFGAPTQRSASVMFLVGRTLANGVRLYVASIFVSMLVFGDSTDAHLVLAILLTAAIATAYTAAGGIKAVIWTDCAQVVVLVVSVAAAALILLRQIDLPIGEIVSTVREARAPDGSSKLAIIDTRFDPALPFTLVSAVVGFTLFNAAAYGADQDLVQRTLTCRSPLRGSASLMLAIVLGAVVSSAFLAVGLLLYVRHAQTGETPDKPAEVFLEFILRDMPAGVRGLALSGLLAASLATLDSALNAMSSSFVNDLVKPLRPGMSDGSATRLARFGVGLAAILIAGFAVLCIPLREFTGETILPFALGVMMYAYTGLLAVYCVALFTQRGSNASCIAALVVGAMTVAALQFGPPLFDSVRVVDGAEVVERAQRFSAGWRMAIGFACAFVVCMIGKGRRRGE